MKGFNEEIQWAPRTGRSDQKPNLKGRVRTPFVWQHIWGKKCSAGEPLFFHWPKWRQNTRLVQFFILPVAKTAPEHENGAMCNTFTSQNGAGTRVVYLLLFLLAKTSPEHEWCNCLYFHYPKQRRNAREVQFLLLSLAKIAPEHETGKKNILSQAKTALEHGNRAIFDFHWPKQRQSMRVVQ